MASHRPTHIWQLYILIYKSQLSIGEWVDRSVRSPTTFHNKVVLHSCRQVNFNFSNWPRRELKFLSLLFCICRLPIRFLAPRRLPTQRVQYCGRQGDFNFSNWPRRDLKFLSLLFCIWPIWFVAQQFFPTQQVHYCGRQGDFNYTQLANWPHRVLKFLTRVKYTINRINGCSVDRQCGDFKTDWKFKFKHLEVVFK